MPSIPAILCVAVAGAVLEALTPADPAYSENILSPSSTQASELRGIQTVELPLVFFCFRPHFFPAFFRTCASTVGLATPREYHSNNN